MLVFGLGNIGTEKMKEECLKRMDDIDQTKFPSYTNKIFVLKVFNILKSYLISERI